MKTTTKQASHYLVIINNGMEMWQDDRDEALMMAAHFGVRAVVVFTDGTTQEV